MNSEARPPAAFFGTSIPEAYEEGLGPFLFEGYARDLASRLVLAPGSAVLETACGTGIVTESLRRALPGVSLVATDLSEAMLAVARTRRGHLPSVHFRVADAQDLPFASGSFDAVVSQFGLMFLEDKARALAEARRVLCAGGHFLFSVWDHPDTNPFVAVVQEAMEVFFDHDPPRFLELPWSFHAREPLMRLLGEAGFEDTVLESVPMRVELPSARSVARGFVLGSPVFSEVVERSLAPVGDVVDGVAAALGAAFGTAPFVAPLQAVVGSGRLPQGT